MTAGIYRILHRGSGNSYIGSSKNVRSRIREHKRRLRAGKHHSPRLQNAWNKHGEAAFDFSTIIICSIESLLFFEQRCLDGLAPAFNVCRTAGSCEGVRRSEAVKRKLSRAKREQNRKYRWRGRNLSLVEIAESEGVPYSLLMSRVLNLGHSIERAVSQEQRPHRHEIEHDGRSFTVNDWAEKIGVHPRRVHYWISEGLAASEMLDRIGRGEKAMSFAQFCRLTGANLTTAKSRVKSGMSVMESVSKPARKMNNTWRNKEAA